MRDYKEAAGLLSAVAIGLKVIDIDYAKICEDAADAIEELLAAAPHWISVEERLPKKDEMVIVYYSWTGQSGTEYKEVSLATLEEIRYCGSKLLGWMPLPEPPKEAPDD